MNKFFIVGCPRSGTTMLQQALNRHSRILIPPETKFFFSFVGHSRGQQVRQLERINQDLGIDLPLPARRVSSVVDGRAYFDRLARDYAARQGKRALSFGEKTPEHTGLLPCIRRYYPDAKIIVLIRDGRDVAASLTRVPWMSPDLYANFAVWLYYTRVIQEEQRKADPNVCFVGYEDIVAAPRKELARVLAFLGHADEPAVADGQGNREGIPARELAWKARALERITAGLVGSFQRDLTPAQIGILERMGGSSLTALGYPLVHTGKVQVSPIVYLRLALHLSRFLFRLPGSAVLRELASRLSVGGPHESFSHTEWIAESDAARTAILMPCA